MKADELIKLLEKIQDSESALLMCDRFEKELALARSNTKNDGSVCIQFAFWRDTNNNVGLGSLGSYFGSDAQRVSIEAFAAIIGVLRRFANELISAARAELAKAGVTCD